MLQLNKENQMSIEHLREETDMFMFAGLPFFQIVFDSFRIRYDLLRGMAHIQVFILYI